MFDLSVDHNLLHDADPAYAEREFEIKRNLGFSCGSSKALMRDHGITAVFEPSVLRW